MDRRVEENGWTIVAQGDPVPNRGNFAVEEVETEFVPIDLKITQYWILN